MSDISGNCDPGPRDSDPSGRSGSIPSILDFDLNKMLDRAEAGNENEITNGNCFFGQDVNEEMADVAEGVGCMLGRSDTTLANTLADER